MRKFAFTICAKNYIGLARALERSAKITNPEISFLVFIADELDHGDFNESLPNNYHVASQVLDIDVLQWHQMSFKYDITEFCTSIKPVCFRYIFSQYNAGGCIYLDPDTFLFGSLEGVYSDLLRYSIILTPHINFIEPRYSGALDEKNLLYSGMYNLGFLALRNDDISDVLLNWWEVRLMDKCFQSMSENLFTDQKWMDFLPSFFPSQLFVSPDLGLNLAPWNFHEREVLSIDNTLHIWGGWWCI